LIFGKHRQLISAFNEYFRPYPNVVQISSKKTNFLEYTIIIKIIKELKPKYIINTSVYTDVNKTGVDIGIANEINCNAVK